ncbi:hypothetical protein SK128_003418 [Halocaridina rubra]|uniref:Major facilitator superfamily associated domain-containing protein n=1 Tax=Halocaridina rubra TaxID=373956 RepID=A0AAN9AGY7_HALRR
MAFINQNLILLKILLFTFYGALGCLMTFLTVHMRFIGLNIKEITWINSILPLTSLVGPPMVGMLADKLGHYKTITVICMSLCAVLHTALLFVPSYKISPPMAPTLSVRCNNEGAALVLDACGHECPDPVPFVSTSFNMSGCRVSCSQQEQGISINEPSEMLTPSQVKMCFYKAESKAICQVLREEQDTLEFNQSLSLRKGEGSAICQYPLQHFTIESTDYTSLTCHLANQHCEVICNATEQVNGTRLLQNPVCSTVTGNPELTLWLYFGIRSLAEMMTSILVSLLEAVALTMVHQHKGDYGREKMWGLIAVGVFSPLAGYLMDKGVGTFGTYSYAPAFYVFDGLMLVTGAVTLALPIEVQVQRKSLMNALSQLIRTSELSVLLFLMTLLGTFWGYLKTFVYVYLEDLGASWLLIGLTVTMGIIPSLPFLYKSVAVVKYCGHHYLIMLAFVGYCIRFTGFSYITNPWWAFLLESLELFTLHLMNVSAATLAYTLAPKTFVATAQSLVWVSHYNIGRCLGTFIGGYLLDIYGNVRVFQSAAVAAAICAVIYLSLHQLIKYINARKNIQPKPQPARENGNIPNGHYTPLSLADERF